MGHSKNSKPKGQPRKVFVDGLNQQGIFETGGVDSDVVDICNEIEVSLKKINSAVHKESSVGDSVYIEKLTDGLGVFDSSGLIGYIPDHLKSSVIQYKFLFGNIIELGTYPISAKVILHN